MLQHVSNSTQQPSRTGTRSTARQTVEAAPNWTYTVLAVRTVSVQTQQE